MSVHDCANSAVATVALRLKQLAYKRYVLAVLLAAYAFNFLDRQVLSVALETIKTELALSDTQLGLLTGLVFAIFYSVAGIPIARWADRGHRPTIISMALGLLSVTVALCGAAGNFVQLLLARVGVGVGEAGIVPPAHSLIASYFDRSERLRAMSIFLLGGPLSVGIGYLAGGWLIEFFGWRAAFLVVATPGLILTVLMRLTVREPRRAANVGPIDRAEQHLAEQQGHGAVIAKPSAREVLGVLWGQRTFRHLLFAFTVLYLFGWGLVQWLPAFFIRIHGMATGEVGTWMAINWGIGGALGTFAGGYLTNRSTANAERRQLRIMALVISLWVPINGVALLLPDKHLALGLMFLGAVVNALGTTPTFALIQSLVPENMRATAVAIVFLLANLIGLGLGPLVVGALSDGFAGKYGMSSLRIALLACTPGYAWVAAHFYRAGDTVMAELKT